MRFNNSALAEAVAHLKLRLALGEKMEDTAKLAVVFDIDDTIIRSGTGDAIPELVDLYRWCTENVSSRLL